MPRQKRGVPQQHTVEPPKRRRTTKHTNQTPNEIMAPSNQNTQSVQVDYEKLAAEIIKQQHAVSHQVPTANSAPSTSPSSLSAQESVSRATVFN